VDEHGVVSSPAPAERIKREAEDDDADDLPAMNRVSVAVEDIDGRAQVVLTVEDVDSGASMQTIFPT
jgi:hypothetical protein